MPGAVAGNQPGDRLWARGHSEGKTALGDRRGGGEGSLGVAASALTEKAGQQKAPHLAQNRT